MARRRPRRLPVRAAALVRARAVAFASFIVAVASFTPARADSNDLRLINLCDSSKTGACPWVTRTPTTTTVTVDPAAAALFRSLASELGVVLAPRLQTPADTLGFSGFQMSVELGLTEISNRQAFWNGVERVQAANPSQTRPPAALPTVGGFLRKGMFSPVPSLELGVGAISLLQSSLWSLQGYAKVALHEGFHDSWVPSVALRFAFADLVGTSEMSMKTYGFDALVSKAFSVAGTARFEPFLGWNLLLIDAQSGQVDATPECDATTVRNTSPADAAKVLPKSCQDQAGTSADFGALFRFPHQDLIVRNRFYAGAKVRLWKLFATAELAWAASGSSKDGSAATLHAADQSGSQRSVTVSAGLDF